MAVAEVATSEHGDDCACTRCAGFALGNDLAVRHGAHRADPVIASEPRTLEFLEWIEETQPVAAPCDRMVMVRLAITYRRIELAQNAITEADRNIGDKPIAAYAAAKEWLPSLRADLDRWMSRATSLERELGRTPASRAKLGLDLAATKRMLGVDLVERYGGSAA